MVKKSYLLIALLAVSPISFGASFDCAKAGSTVEKLICKDETLSKLDEQLAKSYKASLENASDKASVKEAQIEWLKRQRACKDASCLTQLYHNQIEKLKSAPVSDTSAHSSSSSKQKYRLLTGSQLQLCREYLDFINRVPKNPEPNCGMDFTFDDIAKKQGFKEIPWVELNPKDYRELIKNSNIYTTRETSPEEARIREQKFEENYKPETVRLWTATFDLNLDGKPDKVYRIKYRNCDSTASVFIARDDGVLDELTGARSYSGNPFFYQGRAYIQMAGVTEGFGLETYLNGKDLCTPVNN